MHTKELTPVRGEAGLDPEDWEGLRSLGHRMVDDALGWLASLRERPVWQPVPEDVRARLRAPLPRGPRPAEEVYGDFLRDVLPYPHGVPHPRFWGWVNGSGIPMAAFADFLATVMNSNVSGFEQSATLVEEQVLAWLKEMLDFPADTSALLTTGCSAAHVVALAAARSAMAPVDVRRAGVRALPRPFVAYVSSGTHSSVRKAVELLGLGTEALHVVPVDGEHRMDVAALRAAVRADRAAGLQPFCVIATVGSVDVGATDDLEALADLARDEELWLHVDGAFGALAWLCPELRGDLRGLQRADSLAFDLHKWMFLQNDVGCVFVRDEAEHRRPFELDSPYLSTLRGGPATAGSPSFMDYGPDLTRRFRALKAWMALKEHGVERIAAAIRENVLQARHLARRVRAEADLELAGPVPLNVVAYRYAPRGPGVTGAPGGPALDGLNRELVVRLQEGGTVLPSHTTIGGRFFLRAAITNHRSRLDDFDFLADETLRVGAMLLAEWRAAGGRPDWIHHDDAPAGCGTGGAA